jgi:hypothetical protein
MRALCGAIITAGALIGLGLTTVGLGVRFQGIDRINPDTQVLIGVRLMTYSLAVTICAVLIGLGIAFIGLMFHHERRHREHLHGMGSRPETRTVT